MGYWNSRGLRGSTLEEFINTTNEKYRDQGLALIQKIPTPIKPIKLDQEKRTITLAYFEKKSTVDFIGVVQGIPVCFDAKEVNKNYLPLQNIHDHQMAFMEDFEKQKGVAFLLVYFANHEEFYYLPYDVLKIHWENAKNGGRKSIPYSDFKSMIRIYMKNGYYLHYLEAINTYLVDNT